MVDISHGGLWVLQDSEPEGWGYDDYPSDFAGKTGEEGIYLISGHYAGAVEVAVEVHLSEPRAPQGWGKSTEVEGTYPSRVARAWCELLPADDGLDGIALPAERVRIRVPVNGWSTPPNLGVRRRRGCYRCGLHGSVICGRRRTGGVQETITAVRSSAIRQDR